MYRMFCCLCMNSGQTNIMNGVMENVIAANSNTSADGTDVITDPYDVTNKKNVTFLRNVHDLFTVTTPVLKEDWKEAPQGKTVCDEVLLQRDKARITRNNKTKTFIIIMWWFVVLKI